MRFADVSDRIHQAQHAPVAGHAGGASACPCVLSSIAYLRVVSRPNAHDLSYLYQLMHDPGQVEADLAML